MILSGFAASRRSCPNRSFAALGAGVLLLGLATLRAGTGLAREASAETSRTTAQVRFFFAGNGRLQLRHGHFEETLDVRYRQPNGAYDEEALQRIAHFFRSRGDGRSEAVSLRLVELLAYIQERYRARPMILLSGYRSPEFNSALGAQGQAVAFASLHTQALAADIALPQLDLQKLWLRLREERVGGVGFYRRQRFLHIDVGPPRFWEEATSRVGENLSAGNARIFARTDFDRYDTLSGARIRLHSVTALPLRVHAIVRAEGEDQAVLGRLRPLSVPALADGDCWLIREPAAAYEFEIQADDHRPQGWQRRRLALEITFCPPLVERTPGMVRTNLVELR